MTTPRIKTAALLLSIATLQAAAFTLLPLNQVQAQETASLTLTFQGMATPAGAIRAQLFDSESAYNGDGEPVVAVIIPVSGDAASASFPGLPPGRYAVKSFHDVDGDGQMATNPFGMPTEPFAFSNNAQGAMGPANWSDAAFEVTAGDTAHAITID